MKLTNLLEIVNCLSGIVFNPDIFALNESSFHVKKPNPVEQNASNTTLNIPMMYMYDQLIDVQCKELEQFYKEHSVTNVDEKWSLLKLPQNTTFDNQSDFTSNDTSLWSVLFPSSDYLRVTGDYGEMPGGKLALKNISFFSSHHDENKLNAFPLEWHFHTFQIASSARYMLTKQLKFSPSEDNEENTENTTTTERRRRLYELPLYFNLTERANEEFHVRDSYPNYYEMYFEVLRKYENNSTEVLTLSDLCKLAYYKAKMVCDRQDDEYFKNYLDRTPQEQHNNETLYWKMQGAEDAVFGEYLPPEPEDRWNHNRPRITSLEYRTNDFASEISRKYAHQGHVSYTEDDIRMECREPFYETASYYSMLHWREHCLKEGNSEKDCLYVRDLVKFNKDYFGEEL